MKFFNLLAYTALIALISSHNAEAQTVAPPTSTPPTTDPNTVSESDLPPFTYSLTQKSPGECSVLCAQNTDYCTTNCGGKDKALMNFCNATTMAWGCGCSDKVPDYKAYQWPINFADCQGKGQACQSACAPANNTCINNCRSYYTNRCGTPNQPPSYYNTNDVNAVPSYGPPQNNTNNNTLGGSANGPTNSTGTNSTGSVKSDASSLSLSFSIGSAISALAIVAAGMTML
ncbi:2939_t:CDS:2 [Cetraspora pellucida]|uniref:2939_t:CDS:1 n=1 Tax=Cetraspora pellucida TaxID=1433469 RepID=A0A9N9CTV4_9GLOM|nr:2939_t:CDS:2 [Cetraspora pellucida]